VTLALNDFDNPKSHQPMNRSSDGFFVEPRFLRQVLHRREAEAILVGVISYRKANELLSAVSGRRVLEHPRHSFNAHTRHR
jgi:hypothetical protein